MSVAPPAVMAGFSPAIHDLMARNVMDTRPRAGHDGVCPLGRLLVACEGKSR